MRPSTTTIALLCLTVATGACSGLILEGTSGGGGDDDQGGEPDGGPAPIICGGVVCGEGQGCCEEVCVDVEADRMIDRASCGACGNACAGGEQCSGGECVVLAPMPTARDALAVVTARDGRIFAIGGSNGNLPQPWYRDTVEVYTPSTNSWAAAKPLATRRGGLAAVLGDDGRIYAIGGTPSGTVASALATVEVYDVGANTWTTVSPMTRGRVDFASARGRDGKIYVFGGYNTTWMSDAEVYLPAEDRWQAIAPMPGPRNSIEAATADDGRIYVVGGSDGAQPLDSVLVYSPEEDRWETGAALAGRRADHGMATGPDGKLYVVGGADAQIMVTGENLAFAAGAWTAAAPMPTPRRGLSATVGLPPHHLIFAIGGASTEFDAWFNTVEGFSVVSGSW